MISVQNVYKYYKNKKTVNKALEDVSIEFSSQEFVLIKGESGAGKSTLLKLIANKDKPDKGTIHSTIQKESILLLDKTTS